MKKADHTILFTPCAIGVIFYIIRFSGCTIRPFFVCVCFRPICVCLNEFVCVCFKEIFYDTPLLSVFHFSDFFTTGKLKTAKQFQKIEKRPKNSMR